MPRLLKLSKEMSRQIELDMEKAYSNAKEDRSD